MMRRARLPAPLATLALGTLTACRQSPARAEASPQTEGPPRARRDLTAIFACQECHTRASRAACISIARGLSPAGFPSRDRGASFTRLMSASRRACSRPRSRGRNPGAARLGVPDADGSLPRHGHGRHARHRGVHQDPASSVGPLPWSTTPFSLSGMLSGGAHVTTMGADEPGKAEVSADFIR